MRKKIIAAAAALLIITAFAAVSSFADTETFTGFLADNLCLESGTAADGANMNTNPEDHTVMCALMKPCIQSGYSVLVRNSSGGFDAIPLDKKGNRMAVKFIKGMDRNDNIYVQVTGTMKDNMLQVTAIEDAL
jgi:hypothetical protein